MFANQTSRLMFGGLGSEGRWFESYGWQSDFVDFPIAPETQLIMLSLCHFAK